MELTTFGVKPLDRINWEVLPTLKGFCFYKDTFGRVLACLRVVSFIYDFDDDLAAEVS